jgi:N-acetylglucosaminyldiphosphoundecaprenol N-acetyl-beta-D-mannosaminyltransferase
MSEDAPTPSHAPPPVCCLMGMRLARVGRAELVERIFDALAAGQGGWLVTANLDFLRRYVGDARVRALYDAADLRVADGVPLVWASRLQGDAVPERVAGSSLLWRLAERAARDGRSIYLLGGTPAANQKAARVLVERYPGLIVCGRSCPSISSPPTADELAILRSELTALHPHLLLVALGSPKQEDVIANLRPHLPSTWMVGVGVSLSFVAGERGRAPAWMRRAGLEWLHRLAQEPGRLTRRYLLDDLPFALRLFPAALKARLRTRRQSP